MKTLTACCLLLSLLVPAPAQDDQVEELPDIEITVQRYCQPKDSATASVVVLDRAELDGVAGDSVRDALRTVPGIDLRPRGAAGALAGLSLRGAKAEQVLILLDGHRLNDGQGGGFDLTNVPLAQIERIEILRGPASALYGTDAVGGVINLVTKRGGDGTVDTEVMVGSFKTFGLRAGGGRSGTRGSYRLDVDHFSQAGDFEYETRTGVTRRQINNHFISSAAHGRGRYDLGAWGEFSGGANLYLGSKGVPGREQFPTPDARQRDFRGTVDLGHRLPLGAHSEWSSSVYLENRELDYEDKTGAFPTVANHRNAVFTAETLGTIDVARRGRAVFGLDYRRDGLKSTNDGRRHRVTGGVYGLYEFDLGPVTLVPSARLDGQSHQRPIFTPKMGLSARPTEALTIRANVGTAFRAPSFDDLYWPEDAFAKGNPNLRPERATEWDVSLEWRPREDLPLSLGYFNRAATDQIVWQPGAGGKYLPQNVGRVRFQGLEASATVPVFVRGLSFTAGYSYLKATTHSGTPAEINRQLVGQPYHHGSATLRYRHGRWATELSSTMVSRRYITSANTASLPSYAVLDATVRWQTSDHSGLRLELRNLLDTSYRTVEDNPLPGFEFRLAAGRQF